MLWSASTAIGWSISNTTKQTNTFNFPLPSYFQFILFSCFCVFVYSLFMEKKRGSSNDSLLHQEKSTIQSVACRWSINQLLKCSRRQTCCIFNHFILAVSWAKKMKTSAWQVSWPFTTPYSAEVDEIKQADRKSDVEVLSVFHNKAHMARVYNMAKQTCSTQRDLSEDPGGYLRPRTMMEKENYRFVCIISMCKDTIWM